MFLKLRNVIIVVNVWSCNKILKDFDSFLMSVLDKIWMGSIYRLLEMTCVYTKLTDVGMPSLCERCMFGI